MDQKQIKRQKKVCHFFSIQFNETECFPFHVCYSQLLVSLLFCICINNGTLTLDDRQTSIPIIANKALQYVLNAVYLLLVA